MNIKYLFVLVLLSMFSCIEKNGKEFECEKIRNFISSYCLISGFSQVHFYENGEYGISFNFDRMENYVNQSEVAKLYGDTAWNNCRTFAPIDCYINIQNIDVITQNNFDKEHPAGTSIKDILNLGFISYYLFIKNNYDDEYYTDYYQEKILEDVDSLDLQLYASGTSYLKFRVKPVPGDYIFTITVTTTDGEEFSKDITVTFN